MPEGEVQSISYLSPALKQNILSGREHFVLAVNIVGRKRIAQFELVTVMEERGKCSHVCVSEADLAANMHLCCAFT